jgi:hypothetical protein
MKIQEPARVSMRNASLKVGAIGLGRCLRRSIAVLPTILLFSPPRRAVVSRALSAELAMNNAALRTFHPKHKDKN